MFGKRINNTTIRNEVNNEQQLDLKTTKNYEELYENMGCVPYMLKFFHMYNNIGVMGRVIHWSTAYAIESGRTKWFCNEHKKWHNIIIKTSKEAIDICPLSKNKTKDTNIHPRYYNEQYDWKERVIQQPLVNNIWDDILKARLFYFYVHLWNNEALSTGIKTNEYNYINGYVPVIEIDSSIGNSKVGRKDMMNKKIFEDFQVFNGHLVDKFKSENIKFHKHTSGNGLYFILDGINLNKSDLTNYKNGFLQFCTETSEYLKKLKYAKIDSLKLAGWNRYYKSPFSLHSKFDRISLPLHPESDLDYDYISTYQNPLNIDSNISKKIWENANYE